MANEKRVIDLDANLKRLEKESWWLDEVKSCIRMFLAKAKVVDAVEVVHGRWIHDINNLYGCSECLGRETMSPKKLKNYCPNCGAKMDGERKDNESI